MPPKKRRRAHKDQHDEVKACTVAVTKLSQDQMVSGSTSGSPARSTSSQQCHPQVKSCKVVVTKLTARQLVTCGRSRVVSSSSAEKAGTTDTGSKVITDTGSLARLSKNSNHKSDHSKKRAPSKKTRKKK